MALYAIVQIFLYILKNITNFNQQFMKRILKKTIFLITAGLGLLLSSCEKDFEVKEPEIENNQSQFEKLNGFFNADAKLIPNSQLPDAFTNQLFKVLNVSSNNKQSKLAILESYFESKASVIKVDGGIITYALPIKKNIKIKSKLKKGTFSKTIREVNCDEFLYEVFALNVDSNSGICGDLNLVSFATSYSSDSSGSSSGSGSFAPTSIYTTITNTSTGDSSTFSTPTSNSSFSNNNGVFSGIWTTITNITNSIGNFFNNIFRATKCHCAGGSTRKTSDISKENSFFVPACDCSNSDKKSQKSNSESIEFDFSIPLPDSFLTMATADDAPNCDCKFSKIDMKNASDAIKNDYFDCSCNSDSVEGIAILLELSFEQSEWLSSFENIEVKEQICKFVKENNYDAEAKVFAMKVINYCFENPVNSDSKTTSLFFKAVSATNIFQDNLTESFFQDNISYFSQDAQNQILIDPLLAAQIAQEYLIQRAVKKYLHPNWNEVQIYYSVLWDLRHMTLDAFGLIPVIGEVADLANGTLYTIEDDKVNAAFSFASAVPVYGWAAVGVKYAVKIKTVATIGTKVKLTWKVLVDGTIYFGSNSTCRAQLRKVLGLAVGNLNQAHHIIPLNKQTKSIVQKASKSGSAFHMNEALNGIPLSKAVHNGSHANYDLVIQTKFDQFDASNATPNECYDFLTDLIQDVRTWIANNPNTLINNIILQ